MGGDEASASPLFYKIYNLSEGAREACFLEGAFLLDFFALLCCGNECSSDIPSLTSLQACKLFEDRCLRQFMKPDRPTI